MGKARAQILLFSYQICSPGIIDLVYVGVSCLVGNLCSAFMISMIWCLNTPAEIHTIQPMYYNVLKNTKGPMTYLKWKIFLDTTNLWQYYIIFQTLSYVTWSRGMSRMPVILILRYWQKQCSNSFVLYCFQHWQILHNSATRYPIVMGFASKWSILKLWESDVRKWELKFSTSDPFPLIMSHQLSVKNLI